MGKDRKWRERKGKQRKIHSSIQKNLKEHQKRLGITVLVYKLKSYTTVIQAILEGLFLLLSMTIVTIMWSKNEICSCKDKGVEEQIKSWHSIEKIGTLIAKLLKIICHSGLPYPVLTNSEMCNITTIWYALFHWYPWEFCPSLNRNGGVDWTMVTEGMLGTGQGGEQRGDPAAKL